MDVDREQIIEIVRETLQADFDGVEILDIQIQRDVDFEDDEFLNILVVFEGNPKDLDPGKEIGASRHVRPKLAEIGEEAFPVFSFVTEGEFKAEASSAA